MRLALEGLDDASLVFVVTGRVIAAPELTLVIVTPSYKKKCSTLEWMSGRKCYEIVEITLDSYI